jgi:hypothetical protein
MGGKCSTNGEKEYCTNMCLESPNGREYLRTFGVDGRILKTGIN